MAKNTVSPRVQDAHLTYHYRFPLDDIEWNRGRKDLVSTGFLSDINISSFTDTSIIIPPIEGMEIKDITGDFQYRVTTKKGNTPLNVELVIDNVDTFIFVRLETTEANPTDMIEFKTGTNVDLLPTDLIIGKAIYNGSTLDHIDYSYQSKSKSIQLLDEIKSFTIVPSVPYTNVVTVLGGKLVDRVIPNITAELGVDFTLPSGGNSKYIHFFIDTTSDTIQIEESAEAVTPVKPQVSPNFSCGYILLDDSATIIDQAMIDNSNNKVYYMQQGQGSGIDADKLDGAELTDDENITVGTDTIFTTRATKEFILNNLNLIDPQNSVIDTRDFTANEPASPSEGDRHINSDTGNGSETTIPVVENYIYEWHNGAWVEIIPNEGFYLYDETADVQKLYNGTEWVVIGSGNNNGIATIIIASDTDWQTLIVNDIIDLEHKYIVLKDNGVTDYELDKTQLIQGKGTIECMDGARIKYTTSDACFKMVDDSNIVVSEVNDSIYKVNSSNMQYTSGTNIGNEIDISDDDKLAIFSKDPKAIGKSTVTYENKEVKTSDIIKTFGIPNLIEGKYDIFEINNTSWYLTYIGSDNNVYMISLELDGVGGTQINTTFGTKQISASPLVNPNDIRITMKSDASFGVITCYDNGQLKYLTDNTGWLSVTNSFISFLADPTSTITALTNYEICLETNDIHIIGQDGSNVRYFPFSWDGSTYDSLPSSTSIAGNNSLQFSVLNNSGIVYASFRHDPSVGIGIIKNDSGTITTVQSNSGTGDGQYGYLVLDGVDLLLIYSESLGSGVYMTVYGRVDSAGAVTTTATDERIVSTSIGRITAKLNTDNIYKATDLIQVEINRDRVLSKNYPNNSEVILNNPAIDINNENAYFTYIDASSILYLVKSNLREGTFNSEIIDTAVNSESHSVFVDSENTVHVSYEKGGSNHLKYAKKEEGGSWSYVDILGSTITNVSDTSINVNSKGEIIIISGANGGLRYLRSLDNGVTWLYTDIPLPVSAYFYVNADIDNLDKIHIACTHNSSGNVYYVTNDTGAWTYSILDASPIACITNNVKVDSNNNVHVSWYDVGDDIKYNVRNNGTWGTAVTVKAYTSLLNALHSMFIDVNDVVHIFNIEPTNGYITVHKSSDFSTFSETFITDTSPSVTTMYGGVVFSNGKICVCHSVSGNSFEIYIQDNEVTTSSSIVDTEKKWIENIVNNKAINFGKILYTNNIYCNILHDDNVDQFNYQNVFTLDKPKSDRDEEILLSKDFSEDTNLKLNVITDIAVDDVVILNNSVNPEISYLNIDTEGSGNFTTVINDNYKSQNAQILKVNQKDTQNSTTVFNKIVKAHIEDFNIDNTEENKTFTECIHCTYKGFDKEEVIDCRGDLDE